MQTTEPGVNSEKCDDARRAIMRAARSLAEREGVKNLTLAKVAVEANLSRSLVLDQFASKKDLLVWIVADSVVALARSLGVINGFADTAKKRDEPREGAVILTLPRRDVALVVPETMVEFAREVSIGLAAETEVTATGTSTRRVELAGTMESAAVEKDVAVSSVKESAPDTDEKTEASAPYAWLQRRLHVFERAMTALETSRKQSEDDTREIAGTALAGTKALHEEFVALSAASAASIAALQEKIDELAIRTQSSEARQTAATKEVRTGLDETNLRLQTVEGVAHAALVENVTAVPELPPPVLEQRVQVPVTETRSVAQATLGEVGLGPQTSYLALARASAIAASTVPVDDSISDPTPVLHRNRTRAIFAAAVVLTMVAAAGLMFKQDIWVGGRQAPIQTSRQAPSSVVIAAADTPLDRLVRSAEAGDSDAELAVGMKYLNGTSSTRDPAAGLRWTTRAAKHGSAVAQFMLGYLYEKGGAGAADPAQAMRWYEAAALQGNRKAMHNLAVAYAQGLGGVKNPSEAVRWFSRAASFGYVDSQFDLAVLYERGAGVPQSLIDAYKWYAIAGAQGDAESRSRIEALRTQLSSDDLAAAQHAVDAFRPLPFDPAANLAPKS